MPIKPKKPCAKPGCPNLTDGRYCEEHKAEAEKRKAETNKFYDKHIRDKQAEMFYKSKASFSPLSIGSLSVTELLS